MKNVDIKEFRNQITHFYEKFQLFDETNTQIEYKDPTKLIKELKIYEEDYDEKFKKYLENNYNFNNKKEVMIFIKETPTMTGFLYEITPLLKERFPNREYCLEYVEDYEIENWKQISLNLIADFDKENVNKLSDELLTFELEINEKQIEYDLINKFMMDVVPL